MTRDVSADTQEIFGEMQEDLARTKANVRRNRNPQDSDSSGKPLLLWGFIGIILILLIVLLFRGGDKAVTEDLNALKTRVEQMEKRASPLEAAAKKMDAVDARSRGFSNLSRKLRALNDHWQSGSTSLPRKGKSPQRPRPLKRNQVLRQSFMRSSPERPFSASPRNTTSPQSSFLNSTI